MRVDQPLYLTKRNHEEQRRMKAGRLVFYLQKFCTNCKTINKLSVEPIVASSVFRAPQLVRVGLKNLRLSLV